jgi:hypothetical protein
MSQDQRLITVFMDRLPADAGVLIASDIDGQPMRLTCYPRSEDETVWACKRVQP